MVVNGIEIFKISLKFYFRVIWDFLKVYNRDFEGFLL